MAECRVYNGSAFNNEILTAKREDVLPPYIFVGNESENAAVGSMVENGTVQAELPINGTYMIPEGHANSVKVTQEIPVIGPQYIVPTINGLKAGVKGAYMTGNVVIAAIQGISEDVIKKGVQIGPYTGKFEGFVD